ncbi:hypothetical protein FV217_03340 [Methylobacterium sp. WL9]|nr:hypothetical protein FV217_03340 [Methylobacterium sp. WL9]
MVRALIARGVADAIITPNQAKRLFALALEARADPEVDFAEIPQDDERLRFVTGFADIFVTLGIALFLGAAAYLGADLLGATRAMPLVALLSWILGEFFSLRRRMALPSIALLGAFAYAVFTAARSGLGSFDGLMGPFLGERFSGLPVTGAAAEVTLVFVSLHYWRFGVPITVAAGMLALLTTIIAPLLAYLGAEPPVLWTLLVLAGLASFAVAMHFDLSDRERLTRRSDIAFWLHLLAAPLIVHPVLQTVTAGNAATTGSGTAFAVIAIVLALSLVALVTDRRAILVSGLLYAGYAIGGLIQEYGGAGLSLPLTLLTLGAFVLLLSVGWQSLRRTLLRLLPEDLARRMPRPRD